MVLATAPGGVGEMAVTKVLEPGVPPVTSVHVMRLVQLLRCTGALFQLARQVRKAR